MKALYITSLFLIYTLLINLIINQITTTLQHQPQVEITKTLTHNSYQPDDIQGVLNNSISVK